ncbi:MAG: ribosome silencing factor [Tissierellia bacterium]|nr:ribosome silencing factor [Tissierellia bacterium]
MKDKQTIQEEIQKKLDIISEALDNKKGRNLDVLDIRDKTSLSDYFVIVSGNSTPQVGALADEVVDKMAQAGYDYAHVEGKSNNRWIILDYGEVMVHIFHREDRAYYQLDELWKEDLFEDSKEESHESH